MDERMTKPTFCWLLLRILDESAILGHFVSLVLFFMSCNSGHKLSTQLISGHYNGTVKVFLLPQEPFLCLFWLCLVESFNSVNGFLYSQVWPPGQVFGPKYCNKRGIKLSFNSLVTLYCLCTCIDELCCSSSVTFRFCLLKSELPGFLWPPKNMQQVAGRLKIGPRYE